MSPETFVRRARWSLAAAIVVLTVGFMVWTRSTAGFEQRGVEYFMMGVWSIAVVVIPVLLGADLVGHLIHAGIVANRRGWRPAVQIALRTLAADLLLLLLALGAGLALLYLTG